MSVRFFNIAYLPIGRFLYIRSFFDIAYLMISLILRDASDWILGTIRTMHMMWIL